MREELLSLGRNIQTVVGDVGILEEIPRIANEAIFKAGPIDILINNVGGRRISIPTEDLPLTDWQKIIDLNLTSAFRCCQEFGKGMLERKRGSIINITSISGIVVNRGIFGRTYETCKAVRCIYENSCCRLGGIEHSRQCHRSGWVLDRSESQMVYRKTHFARYFREHDSNGPARRTR